MTRVTVIKPTLVTFGHLCAAALSGMHVFQCDLRYFPRHPPATPPPSPRPAAGRPVIPQGFGKRLLDAGRDLGTFLRVVGPLTLPPARPTSGTST